MSHRISFAFRTLVGPWMVVPIIALEALTFLMRGMPWRGEGMWTIDWFAIALFIAGPICAGAAAVDASRLSRPGNIHLVVSVPHPFRVYLRAVAWCAGPVIAVHMVTIVAAVVIGRVTQPSIGWLAMLAAALVQCLAIVWFVALGSALGRFTTPLLAGLIGGSTGFAMHYAAGSALTGGPAFRILDLGAATITMVGKAYNPGYLGGQAIIFGLTSAVLIALQLRVRSGYIAPTFAGAASLLGAIVMILAGPLVFPNAREVANPQPPTSCFSSYPEICLYHEHARFAGVVAPPVQALSRAAREAGYAAFVPDRVVENSRTYYASGPGIRPLWLPSQTYELGELPIQEVAYFMVEPSHCERVRPSPQYGPPSAAYNERLFSLLATWLALVGVDVGHVPVEYRILSPREVKEILDDFAVCDLDGRG